jgi:hypothetical protein
MSKTVVIHQPDFLPYIGFFHRLVHADMFIVLDNAQFVNGTSKSWTHRDKIKTPQGEKWISLSLQKTSLNTPISDVLLSNATDWRSSNLNVIKTHYQKAPFFQEIFPEIERLYAFKCERMMDFNMESIKLLLKLFGIDVQIVYASAYPEVTTMSNQRIVDLVKKVGGTKYLSGVGARAYYDPAPFEAGGVEVQWQEFIHPTYPQMYGEFIPFLSSIDLFFNCGIVESRKILRNC